MLEKLKLKGRKDAGPRNKTGMALASWALTYDVTARLFAQDRMKLPRAEPQGTSLSQGGAAR